MTILARVKTDYSLNMYWLDEGIWFTSPWASVYDFPDFFGVNANISVASRASGMTQVMRN